MPQLCLNHVDKDYLLEPDKQVLHAVQDLNLSIERGEFVFITGSSGAGKSTLLQLLSCNLQPTRGSVYYNGVNMTALSPRRQNRVRWHTDTFPSSLLCPQADGGRKSPAGGGTGPWGTPRLGPAAQGTGPCGHERCAGLLSGGTVHGAVPPGGVGQSHCQQPRRFSFWTS